MELAEYCIEFGRGLGASYVEARYTRTYARGLVYRNGEPIAGGTSPLSGIGIRVLVDGKMGFASFDRMRRDLAEETVRAAFKMAKNASRKTPIDLGPPVSNTAEWSVSIREDLTTVDMETIMQTVDEINRQAQGLPMYTVVINPTDVRKYLVTSEGTRIEGHQSYLLLHLLLTAKGQAGIEQRNVDLTQSGGWERIEEASVIQQVADEVARVKKVADKAHRVSDLLGRPIDVVVGPEVAGIMAHENVGHPSEGDRIMGREGAQAGESFWRDLRLGESRVGSEVVNVSEDPTIPNTSGFYLYDDEGVRARKRRLIKNGVINEPLLNREYGTRFGLGSNGAARATSFNREPIVRMANTFFEPGDYTFEELVEDIKLGIFMTSFTEWNIDDRRYQSKYTGSEAYVIRNGNITDEMVKAPVIETTSVGMLSSIDAVSKELRFDFPGTCGKGDPMQGIPVYAGGGDLRLRGIRLGGMGN